MKQIHPIAECYPKLPAKEYEALKADIQKNGLLVTIVTYEDKVLDGVHRQKACDELGITPRYQEFPTSVDPYALVVSLNERRRQLTTGQRAVVASRMATLKRGRPEKIHGVRGLESNSREVAVKEAAALNKVGATSIDEVRYVEENGIPEIYKALDEGQLKPYRAKEIARLPKAQQPEALKAVLNGDKKVAKKQRGQRARPKSVPQRKGIQAMLNQLQNGKPKLGLTREEFDPSGETKSLSSMEFLDKYGHVQIMTKTELEADQRQSILMAWVSALNDLKVPLEKFLECKPFNLQEFEAWIKRAPDTRLRRTNEKLSLIIKARESIEWLLPILNRSNEQTNEKINVENGN